MLRRVALVTTDVLEESNASIFRAIRMREFGIMLVVAIYG
jgi:hypothetical protein